MCCSASCVNSWDILRFFSVWKNAFLCESFNYVMWFLSFSTFTCCSLFHLSLPICSFSSSHPLSILSREFSYITLQQAPSKQCYFVGVLYHEHNPLSSSLTPTYCISRSLSLCPLLLHCCHTAFISHVLPCSTKHTKWDEIISRAVPVQVSPASVCQCACWHGKIVSQLGARTFEGVKKDAQLYGQWGCLWPFTLVRG